jgi:Tol biopolymer transport system component
MLYLLGGGVLVVVVALGILLLRGQGPGPQAFVTSPPGATATLAAGEGTEFVPPDSQEPAAPSPAPTVEDLPDPTETLAPSDTPTPSPSPSPSPTATSALGPDFVFVSDRGGNRHIVLIRGGDLDNPLEIQPPTEEGYTNVLWPTFCGNEIAVEVSGSQPQWIYIYDIDSKEWRRLSGPSNADRLGVPRCSPDASLIAYSYHAPDTPVTNWPALIVNYRTGNPVSRPASGLELDSHISWPRSMNGFFFWARSSSGDYIYQSSGGSAVRYDGGDYPAVSPDGRYLAYNSGTKLLLKEIGSSTEKLIDALSPKSITGSIYMGTPAWSGDGEWIYFASAKDGDADIYRVRRDGSGMENLTEDWPSNEFEPAVKW